MSFKVFADACRTAFLSKSSQCSYQAAHNSQPPSKQFSQDPTLLQNQAQLVAEKSSTLPKRSAFELNFALRALQPFKC